MKLVKCPATTALKSALGAVGMTCAHFGRLQELQSHRAELAHPHTNTSDLAKLETMYESYFSPVDTAVSTALRQLAVFRMSTGPDG